MTGRTLLWWTRIDDADGGIVHMFCKPICFGKQLGIRVATLIQWYDRHDFSPSPKILNN
jgi:hypothetical protein